MTNAHDKDELSGVETTGHEWDGLKELNHPAPRWWLWVFFITVIWAVGYWVVYPAWPTLSGNTKGVAGWTSHRQLAQSQAEITARRGTFAEKINAHILEEIQQDPELYAFAVAAGKTVFKENCAACHGTGAAGGKGYPNLNDDDWIWGGDLASIYHTLKVGVRSGHDDERGTQMPAFGEMLKREEIVSLADHVLGLASSKESDEATTALFNQNCAACHGESGTGSREMGAPNLADAIWLYGGDKANVVQQITNPRHGVMPNWDTRLPDATIKQLSIYVHSLGGGEASAPNP
ncbi:MAG: cytochrome-c oxidase, cbb3-type subunit III [Alphaproteobacteria bacterium]|nr:cytochrome-c oxidase, cbb3-type subunit III [Alphaproteobacteria bacterium]